MQLLSISNIFSGKIAQALCWMLVHSLWIGLGLTIVTGIIMLCTKRQTALLRYNLLTTAFLAFTATMIGIFIMQVTAMGNAANENLAGSTAATIIDTNNNIAAFNITRSKADLAGNIINFFNSYANTIVLLWFIIIVFRGVRLGMGMRRIKQLKTEQLITVGDHWNERLTSLAAHLNIKTKILFFQSGLAKIPMVVGHFKPVILFPMAVINALPAEEVEAILIHELAHIRRKDYLVNMLQNFIEILFFFNPAILWVSSLIKIERENCCDDIAVSQTSSKRDYINALVSFQEYNLNSTQYATALTGTKQHLLNRVKRMLYNNNKTLSNIEKTLLMVCFIAVATLMFAFSDTKPVVKDTISAITTTDSIPSIVNRHFDPKDFKEGEAAIYSETINGVSHTLRIVKKGDMLYEIYGDISSFKINGQAIPKADWGKYKALLSELMSIKPTTVTTLDKKESADEQTTAAVDDVLRSSSLNKPLPALDKLNAEQNKLNYEQDKLNAEQDQLNAEQNLIDELAKKDKQQIKEQNDKKVKLDQLKYIEDKKKADKAILLSKQTSQTSHKREVEWNVNDGNSVTNSKLSYTTNYNTPYNSQPQPAYQKTYPVYDPKASSYKLTGLQSNGSSGAELDIKTITQNFINDLTTEKVINTSRGLSYSMSNDELIVNGKVQAESLHQKLKAKYIQSPDWKLLYNWSKTNQ